MSVFFKLVSHLSNVLLTAPYYIHMHNTSNPITQSYILHFLRVNVCSVVGPAVTFQVRTNDQNITTASIVNVAGKSFTHAHTYTFCHSPIKYICQD